MKTVSKNRIRWMSLILTLACLTSAFGGAFAQSPAAGAPAFPLLGKIKPRSAKEISSSSWSVGGETLDRDFAAYANYKQYLGPLGAKAIRLQAGWAKCEKTPGVYNWAWLDEIVNDALAQSVQPWLEVSYGNKLYPDGGGTGLGGGLPKSPEALTAWDNWVRALVRRYQDRVQQWEIWNEPDLGPTSPENYAEFFIRTAEVIRGEQANARIYALALAHKVPYVESFLARVQQHSKLGLIDAITVHSYPANPDSLSTVDGTRAVIAKFSKSIQVRQGETGAPSTSKTFGALTGLPWTELTQAKWNLRRMLAHHGKDVPFNLFTLMELQYTTGLNTKGLLKSNPGKTVAYAKPAYFAAQNVFAVFDDSLSRITNFPATFEVTNKVALYAYRQKKTGKQLITIWFSGNVPSDSNVPTPLDFTLARSEFHQPVYADLRTGWVHSIPKENWSRTGEGIVFRQIPIYDSPILIAEQGVLAMDLKATADMELIFQSGFEGTCEIVSHGISQNDIIGKDTTLHEKNDWVEDLEKGAGIKTFGFDYTGGDISQRFVRIIPEPGNPNNKVLWFWLNDSWKADGGVVKARVQADIYVIQKGLPEFYQSVRVFLPEDWNAVKRYPHRIPWCTVSEFWNDVYWSPPNNPKGFRVTLGIGKPAAAESELNFILDAQDPGMKRVWQAENTQVKVPIGKWFVMDYYFKEGDNKNGRFYMAITPEGQARQVVYDVTGWTHNTRQQNPDGLTDYNPLKLYTSKELVSYMKAQGKTLQIYWDDFKLWKDRQPVDSIPSPANR